MAGLALAATLGATVLTPTVARAAVIGTVAGTVFEDYDADGTKDTGSTVPSAASATDAGVKGAAVTVTDATGTVVGSAVTDAAGAFSLPVTAATADVRVEITPPSGYTSGPHGPDSGTTVQFVTLGSSAGAVLAGLTTPGDYSPDRPRLLNVLQAAAFRSNFAGNPPPSFVAVTQPTLVSSAFDDRGTTPPTTEATADQTGAIWGLAQLDAQYAFTAAFFRRHARTGPGGLGAIYLTDVSASPNASVWATIPDAGVNPRGVESALTVDDWFHDIPGYPAVGKIALGGMAIAPDRRSLYVANLSSRSLWQVPLSIGAGGVPVPIGSPVEIPMPLDLRGSATGCPSQADVRPFGVASQRGSVWITLTCTGPAVGDLRGYVYRYDVGTQAFDSAPAFEMALGGYPRGVTYAHPAAWGPWTLDTDLSWPATPSPGDVSRPQPLLSDVAFDSNGDMTIGIKDRFGDQSGTNAGNLTPGDNSRNQGYPGGDIVRACRNAADTAWIQESNAVCGTRTRAAPANNEGPGGGEFYYDDWAFCCHDQVSLGALLQLPGHGQILNTDFDPGPLQAHVRTEGYRFYSNTTGVDDDFHQLRGDASGSPGGGFGKSGGLGDMAALVGAAPIEIGNRVWSDSNGDGLQDAGEPPLAAVTVNLYAADGTTLLATAVTDSAGSYYFSNAAGTSTSSARYGVSDLQRDSDYVVKLDRPPEYATGGPLSGFRPTATAAGPDRAVDSNGALVAGFAEASVRTGGEGASDHTIDFGFATAASLGDFVWEDLDGDGVQGPGEPGIPGVTVHLFTGGVEVGKTTTDANGRYLFSNLAPGTYNVRFDPPPGFTPTVRDAGTGDAVDSDADPGTGLTVDTSLAPGEDDLSWDAGFIPSTQGTGPIETTTTTTTSVGPTTTIPGVVRRPPVPRTGSDVGGPVRVSALLMGVGTLLVLGGRQRRRAAVDRS